MQKYLLSLQIKALYDITCCIFIISKLATIFLMVNSRERKVMHDIKLPYNYMAEKVEMPILYPT